MLNFFRLKREERLLWESRNSELTVQVWERGDLRELRFGNRIIQSVYSKTKPTYMVLPYTRFMLLSLIFCPNPNSVLHLGLGGGSIARWLHFEFPKVNQSIIEKNLDVIKVAHKFFLFPKDERLKIYNADASEVVPKMSEKFDLIFLDVFNDFGSPEEVKGVDFLKSLSNCLNSSGWVVGNFWTLTGDFKNQCENWGSVFSNVFKAKANEKGNEILFGSRNLQIDQKCDFKKKSKILESCHKIEFQKMNKKIIKLY